MNISEILSGFDDSADRREFICGLADAESAIQQALEALPEELHSCCDRLFEAAQILHNANIRVQNWEKNNPDADSDLVEAMASTFAEMEVA